MRGAVGITAVLIAVMLIVSAAVAQESAASTGTVSPEAPATAPLSAPAEPASVDGSVSPETVVPGETAVPEAIPEAIPEAMTEQHAASEPATAEHGESAAAHAEGAGEHVEGHGEEHGEEKGPNYIPKIVNFIIFVSILVYVARKPVAAFFGDRRKDIDESFTKAEAAQSEVATKVAEMEQRLAALDTQVKDILARAKDQAESERQAILEAARVGAQKLLTQAEAQVADLESASVRRLKAMAADLAVDGARELIEKQLGPDDRNRLFDRTLKGLSKASTQ